VGFGAGYLRLDGWLLALLAVSLGLRVLLVHGQKEIFFPDESRFRVADAAAVALLKGDVHAACDQVFAGADHLGFKLLMILPALGEHLWHWRYGMLPLLGAGVFAVANIAWIYALARRLGGGAEEARWAALFAAASCSLFYWSRHLVPYDMALCFGLACLWVSLHPAPRWYHSLLAGALGFLTFATYNGYWSFTAFALVAHVVRGLPSRKGLLLRGVLGLAGLVLPLVALLGATAAADYQLWASFVSFAGSVNQGDFDDGYRVMAVYLWLSEGVLLVFWLGAVAWLVWLGLRGAGRDLARAWWWFAGLAALAVTLVVLSNGLGTFVVYGRLVRQLVPFFALLGGWAAARLCAASAQPRLVRVVLAAAVVGVAAFNFRLPLTQEFDFNGRAIAFRDAYRQRAVSAGAPAVAVSRFRVLKPSYIWPMPEELHLPPHTVLLFGRHPLRFRPFLYEGYNREQRAAVEAADIRPRLVLLDE